MNIESINIEIKNCNNIKNTTLNIIRNHLNIKYAMNGTGKSSLAKIIELASKNESLLEYKPFGTNLNPEVKTSKPFNKVFLFNEDFIDKIIFKESEVILNSFDVFIKTDDYDEKLETLNNRLRELKIEIGKDKEIMNILQIFKELESKIVLTTNGDSVKKTPFIKSILSKDNIYNVPTELKKFKSFFKDEKYNIDWIDWKNKGSDFDEISGCPFCSKKLSKTYPKEKKVFSNTYKKTNTKHIKEILESFKQLTPYINKDKLKILNKCIKSSDNQEFIEFNLIQFINELIFLKNKIEKSISLDSFNIKPEEITKLDEFIKSQKIEKKELDIFNNKNSNKLFNRINLKLDKLLKDINTLQKELGTLNGTIQKTIKSAIYDINSFLKQAGINYKMTITPISQTESTTNLQYIINDTKTVNVGDIKHHLSWGEKNAFALILYMHYTISKNADLIILDDPVSSFDSNKKYAIISRLFKNTAKQKSFYNKTVLLLTHDFEPIIDFLVNTKPTGGFITSKYMKNKNGNLLEYDILREDIKSVIILLRDNTKDIGINIIHRIVFLRKYIEHTRDNHSAKNAYNILSSIIHGKSKPDKKINTDNCVDLDDDEIKTGIHYIKNYITDFDYDSILKESFTEQKLFERYNIEKNNYLKLQIFRLYLEIRDIRHKINNNILLNFIDEAYHIENDYIYYLDFLKFDLVPTHIIVCCNDFMATEATNKN